MKIRIGTLFLAWLIAMVLWGMAHGTATGEKGVDIPVAFADLPKDLVITERSATAINVRILGNGAALRNVNPNKLEYRLDVSGAKQGVAVYEVDTSRIDEQLPRGVRILSRSPANIEARFERRGRKAVRVRPEWSGEPAPGYRVTSVDVDPPRVWLTGARSAVLRLSEVPTETIPVDGASAPIEREARLSLGSDNVYLEKEAPVTVKIQVEPVPPGSATGSGPKPPGSGAS
jgi:YbbR domain-containing protein